jgi:SAM-dependent methyltransferase
MSFSADWLTLREPYDRAARNAEVLDAVSRHFAGLPSIAVVDLACGTGSTLRTVASRLPRQQNWRLIDNDLSLLARAAGTGDPPRIAVTARPVDLARDLELALDGPLDLLTNSALFDLVSQDWLDRLAVEVAARNLPVYAALIYNGEATLDPSDPFDRRIVDAVNRHQRTDKGFGPALGPAAAQAAKRSFEAVGYAVVEGRSDWRFGPDDRDIQRQTLTGWAGAAQELADLPAAEIAAWLKRRIELVDAGRSTMTVGHLDLFAAPTGRR